MNLVEGDQFIILASDGVWEFISNEEVTLFKAVAHGSWLVTSIRGLGLWWNLGLGLWRNLGLGL